MLKAVFLDIDNTLLSFDEYVREFMKSEFEKHGLLPYSEEMFPVFSRINGGLWQKIEKSQITFEELLDIRWNLVLEALGMEFDGHILEDAFRRQLCLSAIPEAHALELLEYLHKKYILCAASNGPYFQQLNRLRIGKMEGYFSHIFISEEIGASKPSKAFFEHCFERLRDSGMSGIRPEETCMIGDSLSSDIAGGLQYGMQTCLYNRKGIPVPSSLRPDYEVSSLRDIMGLM